MSRGRALGWLGTVATLWCIYFFRDPTRVTPAREGLVIAPADGRISQIVAALPPPELGLSDDFLQLLLWIPEYPTPS